MISAEQISPSRRVLHAATILVINVIVWFVIPSIIFSLIGSSLPSLALSPYLIYTFGAIITTLQVLGALSEGMAISVPFNAGSYAVCVYYIWVILNAGQLTFSSRGADFVLSFQPLLFLLVLPVLFSIVRAPITFLLEQSEAGGESSDSV